MPTRRTFDKAEFLPNDNSTPHIVPGVLYPAIGGKLLDGTTSHSGNYGTSQTDSRKYYYTDIKGSRPIRDPRIGAHFGSQRHKFKSIQLLEQETVTEGNNVYSVDGREWIRVTGANVRMDNDSGGHFLVTSDTGTASIVEITGYFNDINLLIETYNNNKIQYSVDGGTTRGGTLGDTTIPTPLATAEGRYIDKSSVLNLDLPTLDSTTLGIHTIAIFRNTANDSPYFGVELIVQDTTNAVTRNKIQIPSQTVFSFGSKFTVGGSSAATHYDPFSVKSDGTGWTSPTSGTNTPNSSAAWPSNIDTATSLGLAKWVDGTNYYRPYNGGRVVKWVDENGEIKTSVNVMPPNAKSIGDSGTLSNGTAKSNGSAPNDNFRPTFEAHTSSVDEDLLSEVAKTYRFREFGNGSANAGTNAGSYKDFSMLSGTSGQENAYVMDDGLTSLAGKTIEINSNGLGDNLGIKNADGYIYFTFIGTGLTISDYNGNPRTFAQNLPYGTHIVFQDHDGSNVDWFMDGVQLLEGDGGDTGITVRDITYHQPKMPPIPEGACIIADYMLMADFLPMTNYDSGSEVSKGIRILSCSRDVMTPDATSIHTSMNINTNSLPFMLNWLGAKSGGYHVQVPFFGTRVESNRESNGTSTSGDKLFIDGSAVSYTAVDAAAGHDRNDMIIQSSDSTLGLHTGKALHFSTGGALKMGFAIPIHTSHHYRSFETPFLKELIGGDRNMEQTHLICSADGKTWDEVTRNTSYIGNLVVCCNEDADSNWDSYALITEWRGVRNNNSRTYFNKDFAIAYDRIICLKGGFYAINGFTYANSSSAHQAIMINGDYSVIAYQAGSSATEMSTHTKVNLKRGDYIQIRGEFGTDGFDYNGFWIERI